MLERDGGGGSGGDRFHCGQAHETCWHFHRADAEAALTDGCFHFVEEV